MIYLDNAATSWPKPDPVKEEMLNCLTCYCANPGRSGHSMAYETEKMIFKCREKLCELFGLDNPANIIFTHNATHALNIVIKGFLDKNKHAVVTSMEHNSVLRPVAASGADYDVVYADKSGYVDARDIEKKIKNNTALIICTLSSNVCGSVQPFEKIATVARKHGIPFLLDASQGAGVIDVNMKKSKIDFLAAPGHKSLLGPTGTGVLCVNSRILPDTITEGGTGSESKLLSQPTILPDRYESGTVNVVGIAGLYKGISYILQRGIKEIEEYENSLVINLVDNISCIHGVRLVGYNGLKRRTPALSVVFPNTDSLTAANILNLEHNIAVRAGFHCAYTAHCTLGTEKTGTVRISPGVFNTPEDVDAVSMAIKQIALQNRR